LLIGETTVCGGGGRGRRYVFVVSRRLLLDDGTGRARRVFPL